MNSSSASGSYFSGNYTAYTVIIIISAIISLLLMALTGSKARQTSQSVAQQNRRIVMVDSPDDVFRLWRKSNEQGRIVVSISRWLNFVEIEDITPKDNPVPLHVTNLALDAEKQLSPENFLTVAVRSGIAREIIHVVNESGFASRLEAVGQVEGAKARPHGILIPFIGTPRTITIPTYLKMAHSEPVLLYVNASIFSEYEPGELLMFIKRSGLHASQIILCSSKHDEQVSSKERESLNQFGNLLGTSQI